MESELMHYGTKRHSGRYPFGSGENPYQHEAYFRQSVNEMKSQGMSEKDIMEAMGMTSSEYNQMMAISRASEWKEMRSQGKTDQEIMKEMGMTSTEYRQMVTISRAAEWNEKSAQAMKWKEHGYSNVQIGKMFDPPLNESSVRNLLRPELQARNNELNRAKDFLIDQLKTKKYIDIGEGSERELSDILGFQVSKVKMDTLATMLEMEGYTVIPELRIEQVTNKGKYTSVKVLAPPDTEKKDIYNDLYNLKSIGDYETESEASVLGIKRPESISSDRIQIRYAEEGGTNKDGVIELRRGVDDLSLGASNYAQVRIAVDGTHYLKGMAVYSDNMPDGVDIIFNTNKHTGTAPEKVFKEMKTIAETGEVDWDNPFGATIKVNGQNGAINKVNEEGDWGEYSKTLSAQFLSKQNVSLAKKQLDLSYAEKKEEYDEIMSLTNSAVKKQLLESFADDCDASAVHLKAASLPRQAFQVILPLTSLKDNEIYAPNYKDGEQVVLVRYPHGGTFEIPQLKVNNTNPEGTSVIGKQAKDAVGINSKVAEQLSGADFDGDTVLVIPVNDKVKVKTSNPLPQLKDFDPKAEYKGYDGMKVISSQKKQTEMGVVSNLITDMTLRGAPSDEIARAVKHSMVVIDSEKHKLDWQRSYRENRIAELKDKYQDGGGASTLISRSKSEVRVPERKIFSIDRDADKETGEKSFRETKRTYKDKKGNIVEAEESSTRMFEAKDAMELVSKARTPMEIEYANYANKLKALANEARKSYLATKNTLYSPTAKVTYAEEVASLKAKLNVALKNAPRERMAQVTATQVVKAKKKDNPNMTKSEEKKARQQAISAARVRLGSSKKDVRVNITDREWEAIQAGAVSNNLLRDILKNTDMDAVKQRAMPRNTQVISTGKEARIKGMLASGYPPSKIAEATGVSVSTVRKYM